MKDDEYAKMILEVLPKSMRTIRTEMRRAAKSDCTVPQFRILNQLSRSQSTNGELADWMGVSPPTMSRMVDSLVKKKFVKRLGTSLDRRRIRLELTARGQETFNQISGEVRKLLAERVSTLHPGGKQSLALGLDVLREMFK